MSAEEFRVLAEEQAALRRVATLVARGVPPDEVFAAVTEEVGQLLSVRFAHLGRYDLDDASMTIVAGWGSAGGHIPAGDQRWSLGGKNVSTLVFETGRPARIDGFADASGSLGVTARDDGHVGSGVGTPVIVEGRLWGVMSIHSTPDQPLPANSAARLASFTELIATAIANAESRAGLARLVDEQAALRRVATLVARSAPPDTLFNAVVGEVGRLLAPDLAGMARYESNDTLTVLATWAAEGDHPLVPGPWPLDGGDVASEVSRTGLSVRIDTYDGVGGRIAAFVRELGIGSSVGSPIVAEGRLWGLLFVHSKGIHEPLPREAESRLTGFAELVATAIANAESRAELAASRVRLVAASDETRRRVERDLHDGAQQRLVTLALELRTAQAELPDGFEDVRAGLSHVGQGLTAVLDELREIARGIHPAILSEGGLAPALKTLARRSPVPVALDVRVDGRLPDGVEVAGYYVVSEMLTNAAKHARASAVSVGVERADALLRISIRDDGIGGADPSRGSGLVGLRDRVEALGGTIAIQSARGGGTAVDVMLPLAGG